MQMFLQMKHFTKDSKSKVLTNFKHSISPKYQKANVVFSSVNRINNSTTNDTDKKLSLDLLTEKLINNSFPKTFVKEKIDKALKGKVESKEKYDDELFLSIPYTNERCSKVHENLLKIFEKYLPKYRIVISWRTIRLSSIITGRLKPRQNPQNSSALIYHFLCPCARADYIGETKRLLSQRVKEHASHSNQTEIGSHIHHCTTYKKEYQKTHKYNQNPSSKTSFLRSHFKILARNQFDYWTRKFNEGFFIHLLSPNLNKQNQCHKLTII